MYESKAKKTGILRPGIIPVRFIWTGLLPFLIVSFGCRDAEKPSPSPLSGIAANEEVAGYMASFEGRGDQADDSQPTPAVKALEQFTFPEELELDLLAAEPLIHQPVFLNFDHRGRLWVVQYSQYPYPAGLRVEGFDYHLRAQFDKVPSPPPQGEKGADKITMLEDTDADGRYDKATDAITGLNIATSVTWGRGHIWVLNPPYLLAYPDPDGDGFPDGDPKMHLRGFGLEDTHAVANSLRWGPDGWLYGAQGSTTTATISSAVTKELHFKGQGIWRYHPETEVFELFAEGGGNTFYVEFDDQGRLYSGHNGSEGRGFHYKQGAYYQKNWGKHGALTNPYAFGYFPHMALEGDQVRFTHGFLRYGGDGLPPSYADALIGINPLHNFVQLGRFVEDGSTFKTIDEKQILETSDHWFRPVDIKAGPDGGLYLADWYDGRLSHIDPRDTWHRASGRIYRLRASEKKQQSVRDLSTVSTDALIDLLAHTNRWQRQEALRQLGDRKDLDAVPRLLSMLSNEKGQTALEALWAIHLSGGFDIKMASRAMAHADPYVRMWAVRLLGDQRNFHPVLAEQMIRLATTEKHPEVRSQLACTAKRLPAKDALPLIKVLAQRNEDQSDAHNPMLIWWALEDKAESDRDGVVTLFRDRGFWDRPIVKNTLLPRLMQRYIMAGGARNIATCEELLALAPSARYAQPLLDGLEEGLRGREVSELSPGLLQWMKRYQSELGGSALALELREGQPAALQQAVPIIEDPKARLPERLSYIRILGEVPQPEAVAGLLRTLGDRRSSGAVQQAILQTLRRYPQVEIGEKIIDWYPDRLRADADVRLAALELLISRPAWAWQLLQDIQNARRIAAADVPVQLVLQLQAFQESDISTAVKRLWPAYQPATSHEKERQIAEIKQVLKIKPGTPQSGKPVFRRLCGSCHQLFGEGSALGPDLTGYNRTDLDYLLLHTIDPNIEIREGYVNYLITTKEGRRLSGRIADQSGHTLVLRTFAGQEIVLPEQEIERMEAQPVSLMPERLLDDLPDQELRDLFAYLRQ